MRPKGSAAELEARRCRAAEYFQERRPLQEIADRFGVTLTSVKRWKRAWKANGVEGLAAKPHPGPKPKLTAKQREQLGRWLLKGARAHGYHTELWTLKRVAEVIQDRFGVQYDSSGVWHVLQNMGWSCQKPERRARERDERAIARWRKKDWPRIKKRATKRPNRRFSR